MELTLEEIKDNITEQKMDAMKQFMISMIEFNVYESYLQFYKDDIKTIKDEELAINYIHKTISRMIEIFVAEDEDELLDKEWADYYSAFISSEPYYNFNIISPISIADLVSRRLEYFSKKQLNDKSFLNHVKDFNKDYETSEIIRDSLNTRFTKWSNQIYILAGLFARQHIDFIMERTGLDEETTNELINDIISPFNKEFESSIICTHSAIIIDDEDGMKINVPNLVLTLIDLIIDYKEDSIPNNIVIVNETTED